MAADSAVQIIDTHLHVWQPSRFAYGWLDPASPLYREVTLDDLAEDFQRLGVTGGVLVEAANTPDEIPWLLEQADSTGGAWGVIGSLPLEAADAPVQIARCARHARFKGVRLNWLCARSGVEGLQAAADALSGQGLVLEILTTGDHLAQIADFSRQHPALTIVLDHLGGAPLRSDTLGAWTTAMAPFSALSHVIVKVSGYVTMTDTPRVACLRGFVHAADLLFGSARLMFGSNYPLSTLGRSYAETIALLRAAIAPMASRVSRDLFFETARTTYRL